MGKLPLELPQLSHNLKTHRSQHGLPKTVLQELKEAKAPTCGWHYPSLTFIYPGFEQVAQLLLPETSHIDPD